jgi:hypothetical protein
MYNPNTASHPNNSTHVRSVRDMIATTSTRRGAGLGKRVLISITAALI